MSAKPSVVQRISLGLVLSIDLNKVIIMPSICSTRTQHHMLRAFALQTRESFGADAQVHNCHLRQADDREDLEIWKLAKGLYMLPSLMSVAGGGGESWLLIVVDLTFIPYFIPYVCDTTVSVFHLLHCSSCYSSTLAFSLLQNKLPRHTKRMMCGEPRI